MSNEDTTEKDEPLRTDEEVHKCRHKMLQRHWVRVQEVSECAIAVSSTGPDTDEQSLGEPSVT